MSEIERCPVCGIELERSYAHGLAAGDTGNGLSTFHREERDCPNCHNKLTRHVGGPWQLAPE